MHSKAITKELTINGKPIKIHAISTGKVAVKERYLNARFKGILAILDFLWAKKFVDWMPIWVFILELPDGIYIFDTGENANVNDEDYFKSSGWFQNWFNNTQFKFDVAREDEIDVHLKRLNIKPSDIKQVILSHLHLDHIDGLRHFTTSEVVVHQLEWEKPIGDLPKLYPEGFNPTLLKMSNQYEVFKKAHFFNDNLILVHTPGHTHGHCSLILKTDQGDICFAADISYHQEQLLQNQHAGADADPKAAANTYELVKKYAATHQMVYLPSHEWAAAERLLQLDFL